MLRTSLRCLILDISRQLERGPAADLERAGGITSSIRLAIAVGLYGWGRLIGGEFFQHPTVAAGSMTRSGPDQDREWMRVDGWRGKDAFQVRNWFKGIFLTDDNFCICRSFQKFVSPARTYMYCHLSLVSLLLKSKSPSKRTFPSGKLDNQSPAELLSEDVVWPPDVTIPLCVPSKLHVRPCAFIFPAFRALLSVLSVKGEMQDHVFN